MTSGLPVGRGVLRFCTLSITFEVICGLTAGFEYNHLHIQDSSGSSVGQLGAPSRGVKEYIQANPELLGRHKFILLSEGRSHGSSLKPFEQYKHSVQEFY
jgi:hypothetical protein